MASAFSGQSKTARPSKERDFPSIEAGIRSMPNTRELLSHQNSSSDHGSSGMPQGPRLVFDKASSREDSGENSSNKKPKLGHLKVGSMTGSPSSIGKVLTRLSPKELNTIVARTDGSADSRDAILQNEYLAATAPTEAVQTVTVDQAKQMAELIVTLRADRDQCLNEIRLLRAKQEEAEASLKAQIASLTQELDQKHVIAHTVAQVIDTPSGSDSGHHDVTEQTVNHWQNAFNSSMPTSGQPHEPWGLQDDTPSDDSDALSPGAYNLARGIWTQGSQTTSVAVKTEVPLERNYEESQHGPNSIVQLPGSQAWIGSTAGSFYAPSTLQPQRAISSGSAGMYGFPSRPQTEHPRYPIPQSSLQLQNPVPRRSFAQPNQVAAPFPPPNNPWSSFTPDSSEQPTPKSPLSSITRSSSGIHPTGVYPLSCHVRQSGTILSPTATEFTIGNSPDTNQWQLQVTSTSESSNQTYLSHPGQGEPMNYRRLLDRNVSCDWKYIVEKIIYNNDQQASIFLQQKLKVGTTDQKFGIIEAISSHAYPLMVNRFGNFLIQRCFEHGTLEQVVSIAEAIRGNTLSLSMDPFGCHVIQKAFDCVPEEYKAMMVLELLCKIPDTVVHRYACHVWQKLFELRWTGNPPQIMTKVNEALRGMWHEVARGETGSLVVQNIFENCVEEEKRPAIEEVLAKIDEVSHDQYGNWCIQHICEHGASPDKIRATDHVLRCAADYSMDQYASKVVEKCLKIGGSEFMDQYLSRVCTGRSDRPRMPLIDIAGDQYGNYLIQWILMNAAPHQREQVATHIRKHMVSLRGSKFGSRVAMLCCNPSHTTRPGPGTGMQIGRFNQYNEERYSSGQNGGQLSRRHPWSPPGYGPLR